jgi:hypothetical protein
MTLELISWSLAFAFLTFLGGILVKRAWHGEFGRSYFAFYLLAVVASLLVVNIFAGDLFITPGYNLVYLTSPAIIGAFALLLYHFGDLWVVSSRFGLAAVILIVVAILAGAFQPGDLFFNLILGVLALTLALWMSTSGIVLLFSVSIVSLAYLFFFNENWLEPLIAFSPGIGIPLMLMFFLVPMLIVCLAAALFYQTITLRTEPGNSHSSVLRMVFLGLAVLMVGYLAYSAYWYAVLYPYPSGEDLAAEYLIAWAGLAGVAAGLAFSYKLLGWQRLGGAAFGLTVPLLLVQAYDLGLGMMAGANLEGLIITIRWLLS